ncbi:MAG: glycosyltransferase family 2 protein [Planctomycetota bacterium]|jgi:glycosyltransferase involved in cell wall biosynthesis
MTTDLVIPAFNEAMNIDALFDALDPLRAGVLRRVVLADNGSDDGTAAAAAARGAVVVHEPRRGYGAACLRALEHVRREPPDVVAFLDADLADDPARLPDLLSALEDGSARIAIGSRVRLAEPRALSTVQRFGNALACGLMALLAGRRYRDLGPMRAVAWPDLERLAMADRTWGWTVEMQMKAALLDMPVVEVDVPYRRRRGGRSKISGTVSGVLRAGTKILLTIVALRLRRRGIVAAAEPCSAT